ncbi:hypothetical protein EV421DRAFT_1768670, partial [Armillaria borealis]
QPLMGSAAKRPSFSSTSLPVFLSGSNRSILFDFLMKLIVRLFRLLCFIKLFLPCPVLVFRSRSCVCVPIVFLCTVVPVSTFPSCSHVPVS